MITSFLIIVFVPVKKKKKHPEDCEGASDDTTGEESDVMSVDEEVTSMDGEVGQRKNEEFPKAPDHINTIIHEWGKGTTCELRWGFKKEQKYASKGVVVKRTVRKGIVKLKVEYKPSDGDNGPSGFIYLPPSAKVKIWSIKALCLNKVKSVDVSMENTGNSENKEERGIEGTSDLEPLPKMAQIDPTFAVHVIAIFRSIIKAYPKAQTEAERTVIWHKLLDTPRDSLATIRLNYLRRQSSVQRRGRREWETIDTNITEEERLVQEVDKRSIRNALQAAKAGNLGKATRILDNVYKDSALPLWEKVDKLRDLHPKGPTPQTSDRDFPRIAILEPSELRLATEKLSKGAAPGPTGLSESMMRILVEDEESCLSLCHMLRDVINGEVAKSVRVRLTRCRMIALAKPNNGIRPVAMGETLLKICGCILLERHANSLSDIFQPIQRGILQKNACESIVHELLEEHEAGATILTIDFKNAYNTPQRTAIEEALLQYPVFKHFMRMFYFEYGQPSELLFFANDSLHSVIESSSGVRQGSALSSVYFCALLQGPLKEIAKLYPEVTIRAYQDDVTMSSKNESSLEVAFLHLKELASGLNLEINSRKCEVFQGNSSTNNRGMDLKELGVEDCVDSIKVLGAYIGHNKAVERKLLEKLGKHKCLFRRLRAMGPSNLSLAILKRCTIPRHDYHLRVHKPGASFLLAQVFDEEIHEILKKWCGADSEALKLSALPCKMGGLGITSTVLKQRYFFEASLKSIDERSKPINAPVDKGGKKQADSTRTNSQAARTQLRKSMKNEHEKTAAELNAIPRFQNIIKRTKEANNHLDSTCNYVNPYLFRYTLMMRLGIALTNFH